MKKEIISEFCNILKESDILFKNIGGIFELYHNNDELIGKLVFQFKSGKHMASGALCSFSLTEHINENIIDKKFIELGKHIPQLYPTVNDFTDKNDTPSNFKIYGSEFKNVSHIFRNYGIISIYKHTSKNEIHKILNEILFLYVFTMRNYYFCTPDTISDVLKYPNLYKYPFLTIAIVKHLNGLPLDDFLNNPLYQRLKDFKLFPKVLKLLV
ncbi:Uncharacterised protein [Kingella potus]|uniref:Uncharacterized protein n=1 Tax=Kingella potus TaxID=265175 RepID=A0A377QY74_9NEIS|nr:hypothetical protein [Kingella potus]UOP01371.1 hypothetical protein LVJ84_03820 [Kingella potus]STR00316.1 Uncharacterised protein [Kingella potus]